MPKGMCAGIRAGESNGHHLGNDVETAAKISLIGSRVEGDEVYYPDNDFQLKAQNGSFLPARKDSTSLQVSIVF